MSELRSCDHCHRHVMAASDDCPFCGAALGVCAASSTMHAGVAAVALGVGLMLGGCSRGPEGGQGETTEATGATASQSSTVTSDTTEASTSSDSESESEVSTSSEEDVSSGGFYAGWGGMDMGESEPSCDPYDQSSCPEGEKCTTVTVSGLLSANVCREVLGDGQPGESCMNEGAGLDDCAPGGICLNGSCTELCGGSVDAPLCGADASCVVGRGGALPMCLDDCDPLAQACPQDEICIFGDGVELVAEDRFFCVQSGTPNLAGESCSAPNQCSAGLACVSDAACSGDSCCQPFCDVTAVQPCAEPMATCELVFPNGTDRPAWDDVGVCRSP